MDSRVSIYVFFSGWAFLVVYALLFYESAGTPFLAYFLSTSEEGIRFRALALFSPLMSTIISYLVNEREKYVQRLTESMAGLNLEANEKQRIRHDLGLMMRAIEECPVGVTIADRYGVIIYSNAEEASMHGYEAGELIGQNVSVFGLVEKGRGCEPRDLSDWVPWVRETVSMRKDGTSFPVQLTSTVVGDDEGNPENIITLSQDVSGRKACEEAVERSLFEKDLLLAEVHHRVRNNLAVIMSMLHLQKRKVIDPGVFANLKDIENRVMSMALVHDKLFQSADFLTVNVKDYILTLVWKISSSMANGNNVNCVVDADDIALPFETLIPCGLILNELLSNSYKHAFTEGADGNIRIRVGPSSDGMFELAVQDDGKGFGDGYDNCRDRGVGLNLVNALVEQLEGKLFVEGNGAAGFQIMFPALGMRGAGLA